MDAWMPVGSKAVSQETHPWWCDWCSARRVRKLFSVGATARRWVEWMMLKVTGPSNPLSVSMGGARLQDPTNIGT